MIEPQSNYIEHPELVAQRLERWAEVIQLSAFSPVLIAVFQCMLEAPVSIQTLHLLLGALAKGGDRQ